MKKTLIASLLGTIISFSSYAQPGDIPAMTQGIGGNSEATQRDNYFSFSGASAVTFSVDSYSITSGQPWGGVSANGAQLDFKAGRKGSSSNSDWVANQMGPLYSSSNALDVADAHSGGHYWPGSLNFAAQGILGITYNGVTYSCSNVIIGQGNAGSVNNWWVFTNTPSSAGSLKLDVLCTYQEFQYTLHLASKNSSIETVYIDSITLGD